MKSNQVVIVNGCGDLTMSHKRAIGESFYFIKRTKGGMAHLQSTTDSAYYITVPFKNVDGLKKEMEEYE